MNDLKILNVCKKYQTGEQDFWALKDVTFEIESGKIIAITGPSGSGKTTLFKVISKITEVTSGEIIVGGVNISNLNEYEAAKYRLNEIGFVFQDYQLVESLNVHDNICLPCVLAHDKIEETFLVDLSRKLGIENELNKMPSQLSGGQKQRVAIARALIRNPKIILADEPTGNLDSKNGNIVMDLLFQYARQGKRTLIYVTHDNELAERADRIIKIFDGGVV